VASFAHSVGRVLVSRHPNQLTLEFAKADRGGRIRWTPDAMNTAQPLQPFTRYAPGKERRSRHHAPGTRWRAVRSGRKRLRSETFRSALRT
jgi:hypothetical protein